MKTLIQTSAELKSFTGASTALSIESLDSHLVYSWAEDEIIKILGADFYQDLLNKYDAEELNNAGNEALKALLPFVQKPLANLAIYSFMQEGSVSIEDQGITADRNKSAYQWQHLKAEGFYLDSAYRALDRLISFLLKNTGDYAGWVDTAYHNLQKGLILSSPSAFSEFVNIKDSYRTYVSLMPVLRQAELNYLMPAVGATYFAELKASLSAPSDNDKIVLDYLKPALAFYTMADAIEDLNLEYTGDGAYIISLKANTDNIKEKNKPSDDHLSRAALRFRDKAQSKIASLSTYLNNNASASMYPLYFASDLYQSEEEITAMREQSTTGNLYNALK
tara:strand:+ start:1430 stop:2434 length:1005 start_codon:yes stop_codon:yes gene_type:complete